MARLGFSAAAPAQIMRHLPTSLPAETGSGTGDDEVNAALVLISLGSSPRVEPAQKLHDAGVASACKSSTTSTATTMFQCTWPKCEHFERTKDAIRQHVKQAHLSSGDDTSEAAGEDDEDFYYYEYDTNAEHETDQQPMESCSIAVEEDGDSQYKPPSPSSSMQSYGSSQTGNNNNNGDYMLNSFPTKSTNSKGIAKPREVKKCRKVYGMENRELWCTQCKWKKACTRFLIKQPRA